MAEEDAHDAGRIVVYAEMKLGELLAANPTGFHQKNSGQIKVIDNLEIKKGIWIKNDSAIPYHR